MKGIMNGKALSQAELGQKAREVRKSILRMIHAANSGHPGGALGMADVFTMLYSEILNVNPSDPMKIDRDRLLLSNGHISAVRYAAMAHAGFFQIDEILSFRKLGSPFQGHPATRYIPAMENSSGSLGQGLSQAIGLALGARLQGYNYRVFVGVSDGEMGEGMNWEAAQAAAHHKAPVIAFMDHNGIQIDGFTKDVCDLRDLGEKFRAFGWRVMEANGHDFAAIREVFHEALEEEQPTMILFHTILGKGVSFMENQPKWHGKAPSDQELELALGELDPA